MVYGGGPVVNDPLGTGQLCKVVVALRPGDVIRRAWSSALTGKAEPPGLSAPAVHGLLGSTPECLLDAFADHAEDAADLRAEEDEGTDRDDRDQSEDQRVLRETLAFLVPAKRGEKSGEQRH